MKQKKSLGQNFLRSQKIIEEIVKTGKVVKGDLILEIGPGEGILTEALLQTGAIVVSVEKDNRLVPLLKSKFESEVRQNKLKIMHADILDLEISRLNLDIKGSYKVVANIPYYITGQILRKFLELEKQPESITLMVQKEVAERIVARDKKESLLSLSVKAYGNPRYIKTVSRAFFKPQPKVDSAILHIENIGNTAFPKASPWEKEEFFKILHAGFAHKRKQLFSNLCKMYKKETVEETFETLNLPQKIRAEDLSFENWLKLAKILSE